MGKVGKYIAGAVLIVGGIAIGYFTGNWNLGLAVSSMGIGLLTRPKLKTDQGTILQTRVGTQNGLLVVYGKARVGGVLVDARVDQNSSGKKRLVVVIAWCHGSRDGGDIQAIDEVWFDDRLAISGSTVQSPFNTAVSGQGVNHLEYAHHLGSSQSNYLLQSENFSATWDATGITLGTSDGLPSPLTCGDVVLTLVKDPDATQRYVHQAIAGSTLSVNGSKSWGFSAKKGTALLTSFTLYDETASQHRCAGDLNWNADGTFLSCTGLTSGATFLGATPIGGGAYTFLFQSTSGLLKANTNAVYIYPAGSTAANTGSTYLGGVFVADQEFPATYRKTTTAVATVQAVDSRLTALFPGEWPSSSKGAMVAYSRFELWFNTDIYPGGLPTIQAVIRGNRTFDPRSAAWQYSENPALSIRDYIAAPVYGLKMATGNIDDQNLGIDMPNYCDESVTIPGIGTAARYTLDGAVNTTREVKDNLASMTTACRGTVINQGDRWRLVIRRQRFPSGFVLDENNTREGSWKFILPGSESPNVVRATYVDPLQQWQPDDVEWPPTGTNNQYLAADNGYESRIDIDLPFTTHRARAQQIAMTLLKEARIGIGMTVELKEAAGSLAVQIGDVIAVSQPTPGWSNEPFDVLALLTAPDGSVQAILSEYDDTAYDLDTQPTPASIPATGLPNPFVVSPPIGLGLDGSSTQALVFGDGTYVARIRVSWTLPNDAFIDHVEIEARENGAANYDAWGQVRPDSAQVFFIGPVPRDSWDVRIRSVNRLNVASTWVAGSVTVADRPPNIMTLTTAPAHADSHGDQAHQDVAHSDSAHSDAVHGDTHGDAAHVDSHTDSSHTDSHSDSHSDAANSHEDAAHGDDHGDFGGSDDDYHADAAHADIAESHDDSHSDTHTDAGHSDTHSDGAHNDSHIDTHGDSPHADAPHSDGHLDSHGDGNYGVSAVIQADADAGSIKFVARKTADPSLTDVRSQVAQPGRNIVAPLIDAATGAQFLFSPGDTAYVAALAYSRSAGVGTEGPLAKARTSYFPVAPVGSNLWVP